MPYIHKLACLSVVGLGFALVSLHAQTAATPATPPQPAVANAPVSVDQAFIQKQFGEEFTLVDIATPYVRDMDGDGVDDLVIVARSKKPMLDAAEHSYRVV